MTVAGLARRLPRRSVASVRVAFAVVRGEGKESARLSVALISLRDHSLFAGARCCTECVRVSEADPRACGADVQAAPEVAPA